MSGRDQQWCATTGSMDSESRLLQKPFEKDCLARSIFETIDCILEESLPIGKFKTNELVTRHMRLTLYKARTVQAILCHYGVFLRFLLDKTV